MADYNGLFQDRDPKAKLLLKSEFPKMLKELVDNLPVDQYLPKVDDMPYFFCTNGWIYFPLEINHFKMF